MLLSTVWNINSARLQATLLKGLNCYLSMKSRDVQQTKIVDSTSSSTYSIKGSCSLDQFEQEVKPFYKIPGPVSLPLIGTLHLYKLFKIYSFKNLYTSGLKKYLKYGPLVREEIMPGYSIVWVFDPNDIEKIFLSENDSPKRRSHLAVGVFRNDRPEVYNTGGLLNANGEDWRRLRREFQKGFSAPQAVRAYLSATDSIIQNFVSERLDHSSDDFLPELSRLFLQLTCLVAFDEKFPCFLPDEMKPDSWSSQLMKAALTANSLVLELDHTKEVKKSQYWPEFEKAMLFMEKVAVDFVQRKAEYLSQMKKLDKTDDDVPSLLELYLTNPKLDYKDVVGMTVDLLLAGIDTTAYTASFALYHLAKNEKVQQMLRLEASTLLQYPNQPITGDVLAQAQYARAVLKEVFRMNPISVGVGRIASEDFILSGYNVPKGTNLVTQNQVSCRLEKYFVRPHDFIPERWMKGSPVQVKENPYLVLPFGHGPRSCIARRLAEQHLLTLLLRVVQRYQIIWSSKETLDCGTSLINKPDQPMKLSFLRQ